MGTNSFKRKLKLNSQIRVESQQTERERRHKTLKLDGRVSL